MEKRTDISFHTIAEEMLYSWCADSSGFSKMYHFIVLHNTISFNIKEETSGNSKLYVIYVFIVCLAINSLIYNLLTIHLHQIFCLSMVKACQILHNCDSNISAVIK